MTNQKQKINTFAIIGALWGDEGKGRTTDIYSQDADIVVRFQGGNNAAHTVITNNKRFVFSVIPAGIFSDRSACFIANGVIFNPSFMLAQCILLEKKFNIDVFSRLKISSQAHLIMPYHISTAYAENRALGKNKLGSCLTGIRWANCDKIERKGIKVEDLLNKKQLAKKMQYGFSKAWNLISNFMPLKRLNERDLLLGMSLNDLIEECLYIGKIIAPLIEWNSSAYLNDAIKKGKKIVFEGAQGTMLDVEHGTYPYCSSSDSWAGGICKGAGVSPFLIKNIVGVVRVYSTRADKGPFPAEIKDKNARKIIRWGRDYHLGLQKEIFSKPLRVGWLDAVALRYASQLNNFTQIAVTKLDVFDKLKKIKICVAYDHVFSGKKERISLFPTNPSILEKCRPVYEIIDGWCEDTTKIRRYKDLPKNAKKYINRITEITNAPISIVGVGPEREATIKKSNEFFVR